jgi:hypothetical protein
MHPVPKTFLAFILATLALLVFFKRTKDRNADYVVRAALIFEVVGFLFAYALTV